MSDEQQRNKIRITPPSEQSESMIAVVVFISHEKLNAKLLRAINLREGLPGNASMPQAQQWFQDYCDAAIDDLLQESRP